MKQSKPDGPLPQFLPRSIARMLWKQKVFVIVTWFCLSAAAVFVIHRLPSIYAAETLILVDSQKIPERYVSSTVSSDLQDRLATISQQILSGTRLKKIIGDLDLYRDERKTLVEEEILEMMRKDITIKLERGWTGNRPGAFRIGYQGRNPAVVAQVTNSIANLFIDENLRTREVQAAGTAEFIDNQLQEAKKALDAMEEQVSQYKLQHNGELPEQETSILGALNRLQLELQANRDGLTQTNQQKTILENSISIQESATAALLRASEAARLPAPELVRVSPVGGARPTPTVKPSVAIEAQIASLRAKGYSDIHPDMRRLARDLAAAKAAESKTLPEPKVEEKPADAKADAKVVPSVLDPRDVIEIEKQREQTSRLKVQLQILTQETDRLKVDQGRILKDISQYQARLEKLPVREQEMARVTRDYEIQKENYKSLLDKKIAAEMATDMERRQQSERFTILDRAQTPEKPAKPNRTLLYSITNIGALLLGLTLGTARELKKNVLLGEWELPNDKPLLACLPFIEIASQDEPAKGEGPAVKRSRAATLTSMLLIIPLLSRLGSYLVYG